MADYHDGPLYLVMDAMLAGIRQFLTFEESLRLGAGPSGATLDRSLPRGGPPVTSEGKHRV
ncbi:hypothetical protein GCM10007857_44010 [Bradyrhizobium iriomotense]|uniref:Uncharacterized protein n=1 Tax=Bradyrhizobium iriomotense TaxID=441950 RepID=A0ABQ6B1X5_9BRAD|nr:hypothetical protein GCM10007857_44010 [Bradyrhizobium iriomotense]